MINQNRIRLTATHRSLSKALTYLLLITPLILAILQEFLKLPGVVRFLGDLGWIGILILLFLNRKWYIRRDILPLLIVVLLLFADTLLAYFLNYQSPFYYIWGVRNNFRFYVAFFSFISFFDRDDAYGCLNWLDKVFWLNAVVCLIQYSRGYAQDFLGGIFGVSYGCNGYLITFFIIVISKSVLMYMNGQEGTVKCLPKCATALVISMLAELKFFFFIFVLILVMAMVLTRFSGKKVLLIIVGAILVSTLATMLGAMYRSFENFFSLESIIDVLTRTNYASDKDIGRFNGVPILSRKFMDGLLDQLFGLGLGNCDVSSMSLFCSPFYNSYSYLRYYSFSYAFMFLENGYVGLFLYVLFFGLCLLNAFRRYRRKQGELLFSQLGILMAVICFILLFYNSSLRVESGYLIYFVLALPFIEQSGGQSPRKGDDMK